MFRECKTFHPDLSKTVQAGEQSILDIEDLSIQFPSRRGPHNTVVSSVGFSIRGGEVLAIVGESGSGKTMVARSILQLLPPPGKIVSGRIGFMGKDLTQLDEKELRKIRGARIGMVFQEPMTSLNPALTVGYQVMESMRLHSNCSDQQVYDHSVEMLRQVSIEKPEDAMKKYPHEFSGGMRQRILLASVLMMKPDLLIADEPTTALDVLIQKQVLDIMVKIARDQNTAILLITHDLGVVAQYADRILVMRSGKLVEEGSVDRILAQPQAKYTKNLLESLPHRPAITAGTPLERNANRRPYIEATGMEVEFRQRTLLPWGRGNATRAVNKVDLQVFPGETVGLVGESGSGKTTLSRALLGLVNCTGGSIVIDGVSMKHLSSRQKQKMRQNLQIVFQDPYSSLDPRMRIGQIICEGLRHRTDLSRSQRAERVVKALHDVELSSDIINRFPHQLSGGQRQRVCIARALILEPDFLVADEAVSALDVTVQAQILELLKKLQEKFSFACLFVSHDLGVIEQVSDRIVVLFKGTVVEQGRRDQILDNPKHPYTQQLLCAVPELQSTESGGYKINKKVLHDSKPPKGYLFANPGGLLNIPRTEQSFEHICVDPMHYVLCAKQIIGKLS